MRKTILGRTGLSVTIAGLGGGGHSRLGMAKYGQDHAAGLIRQAYESGVNFFDTAAAYGTEPAFGQGLSGLPRQSYVLSTKFTYSSQSGVKSGEDLMLALENSLRALRTDYVDVYHIHGVRPEKYSQVAERLYPALEKAKQQGKIRFPGITEAFGSDTAHEMLTQALVDDLFDVIMVGYNLLNPSAAKTVLPTAREKNLGVLCMFAVRSALSNPAQLAVDIQRILERGQADPPLVKGAQSLAFLTEKGVAGSIMEAAYRYCSHTDGVHVTLTGTGSPKHLEENLRSISLPPLPEETLERLETLFGRVDCVSGQ
ncbi:MAG: aldo/keto reductase [Christensenellales bacterium]|jgi:L-galactose dehydrogenase